MKRLLLALAALALVLGGVGQAEAAFLQNTTGIPSPDLTITFDEHVLPPNTPLLTTYSDLGVTFSPGFTYSPQNFSAPHIDNTNAGNFFPVVNPVSIFFNVDQTAAAFAFITNDGTSTFTALENGVVVDTGTAHTDTVQTNNFFGFTGVTFNEIRINAGGFNNAFLLDNLQLGAAPVPEPASLVLLSVGGVGLVGYGWRRRKTAKA